MRFVSIIAAILLTLGLSFAQEKPASIPDAEITALKAELANATMGSSSVEIRRACKGVIRAVDSLLETNPDAPNRYEVLEILFNGQKRLVTLEATDSNRAAIYDTCARFRDAPDEYAETRFDADMILSEKELAEADATVAERTEALKEMLARYRGTAAEWKSLLVGSLIASKLMEFDLEKSIDDTMAERFGGDHKVIEFRRKRDMGSQVDAVFSGAYRGQDGETLVFPYDLIGQQYVVYFWSETSPELEEHVNAVKEVQETHPGRFKVYSFNVDDLPDAGEKRLRKLGVKWPAMHLPGGRGSVVYEAYAKSDPNAVFVNGQGHVLLVAPPKNLGMVSVHGVTQGVLGGWNLPGIAGTLDDERYLAQLRYIFIGDYLVADAAKSDSIPNDTLSGIQACFVIPPFRYRLSQKESLDNYRKAEKLCAAALKQYSKDPDIWMVRNRRIISLIGISSLAGEPKHLDEAVREAETVLAMDLPAGADVVARFCVAKAGIRSGSDPETLVAALVEEAGGETAPQAALAAAASIALAANGRSAYEKYRSRLLEIKGDSVESELWSFCALLRDKHHQYRNFWASPGGYGFGRPQKYKLRDTVAGLDNPDDRARRLAFELTTLDEGKLAIPNIGAGRMFGVVFVEPPSDVSSNSNVVRSINGLAGIFTNRGVEVAVAVLSDNTNAVKALVKGVDPALQVGMVAGGLHNPIVRQLGVLSADEIPNPVLYRADGTLAWTISGIDYRAFGERMNYAIDRAIESNIQKVRSDEAFETLERGDFKLAIKQFDEYVPCDAYSGKVTEADWWTSDRHQGRALAYMGLKDWNKALPAIDAALDQRKTDFKSAICKCHGLVEMYLTKATILDNLKRGSEAAEQRRLAAAEHLPHSKLPPGNARTGVPVGVYYDLLKKVRLDLEK